MRINKRIELGVRALRLLKVNKGPIRAEDLATFLDTSKVFMEQIMLKLNKSLLVKSVRGPNGGHLLAFPEHRITLLDVCHAFNYCLTREDSSDIDKSLTMALGNIVV